jgi:hypothetical protein
MSVILQGDLIVNPFWKTLRKCLDQQMRLRGIVGWDLQIRPLTRADEFFSTHREEYNLTSIEARRLDRNSANVSIDDDSQTITIAVPDRDDLSWAQADSDHEVRAADLACYWIEEVEILVAD